MNLLLYNYAVVGIVDSAGCAELHQVTTTVVMATSYLSPQHTGWWLSVAGSTLVRNKIKWLSTSDLQHYLF